MAPSRISPPPSGAYATASSAPADADLSARRLLILYATTTGTAQDTAERVARVAARRRWQADVLSVDEWDMLSLPETPLVLFILSTTGAGDFPGAALPFWHFLLRATLPPDVLDDVAFATFGLGDSSYAKYCWPTRKLNKRLKALGAHEVCEAGEGDDQHYLGIDGTLHPWLDSFFSTLDALVPLPAGIEPLSDSEPLPPRIVVRRIGPSSAGAAPSSSSSSSRAPLTPQLREGQRWGVLRRNERVTPQEHWQDVRLVEWETEDGGPVGHSAGDIAAIRPQNLPQDIERFMEVVGWAEYADEELELSCRDRSRPLPALLPARATLRELLTQHLDPFSVPRQSFFELIRHFSPRGHMQREKLDEFCTPGEGADDMYEYAQRVRRSIAEVLAEFESVRVPLEYVCEVLPLLRERQFSIASSPAPAERPNGVQLAVAMVEYKTRIKEVRRGVCSRWLSQLPVGTRLPFSIVPGTLRLPAARTTPMILVGPGTGVAPIRALVHERLSRPPAPAPDDVLVLLGCRNRTRDFLFGEEWRALAGETPGAERRLEYRLAASRDQEDKVYVQHVLRDEGARVWDMLRRGAVLYISGSSGKMPEAVRAAVVDVCVAHAPMQEAEAQAYVEEMDAQGRWQEECWS